MKMQAILYITTNGPSDLGSRIIRLTFSFYWVRDPPPNKRLYVQYSPTPRLRVRVERVDRVGNRCNVVSYAGRIPV